MNRCASRKASRDGAPGTPRRLGLEHLEAREVPAAIGSLDPSFGTAGLALVPGTPLAAVKAQTDGRLVVAGTAGGDFFVARYTADGTPDTSFDGDGVATIDLGGVEAAADVTIQADGKVVVVGTSGTDFGVARLNADGSPDLSFDTDGKLTIDFGATVDAATALAVDADGKIVVVGTNGVDFAVARINPADGSLDNTFGTGGKATFDITGGPDVANAVAIQGDGLIVLAGTGTGNFAVARVKADGSALDPVFDTDGKQTVDFGGTDVARALAIDPAGKILVAGGNGADIAVARLSTVGSLDTTFDGDGKQTVDVSGTDDASSVFVLAGGKILLVGDTAADLALVRLTTAGALDATFGGDGKIATDVNGVGDLVNDALITAQGRLVVAGQTGAAGTLARVIIELDETRNVAVGGSLSGQAVVYAPDATTGKLNPTPVATISVFGVPNVNVRVAVGDVNADGVEDTIVVTGPGTPVRLAVVSGVDNTTQLVAPFDPFGGNFTGGAFVSAADFDNDGRAEIVVTPDLGGGPRVAIYRREADGSVVARASFFGIADPGFRGGARSGTGDVDGDGFADLAVAAGFQGGPRVALFDGATLFGEQLKLVGDFFAFDPVLRNGTYVTIGDIDGDGFGDLIFGAGPGGAPRLLAVSGNVLLTQGAVAAIASPLANFFVAGNATDRGGVRVSTADVDGDGKAEVVTGTGEFQASRVRVYYGANFGVTGEPAGYQDLDPFGGTVFANGIFVG